MVSLFILFFCWHLQNKMYLIFQRAKPKQKHNKKKSPRLKPRKNSPDRWAGLEMVEEITLEELTATSRPMYGRPSSVEESRLFSERPDTYDHQLLWEFCVCLRLWFTDSTRENHHEKPPFWVVFFPTTLSKSEEYRKTINFRNFWPS